MFKSDSTVYSLTKKNLLSCYFSYLFKKISSPDYPIPYLIQKSSGTLMLQPSLINNFFKSFYAENMWIGRRVVLTARKNLFTLNLIERIFHKN